MTNGWENQEIGDWGEAIVKATLAQEQITVIELTPDLGEEFLVEIEGRKAVAEGLYPQRALVQVKTHSNCPESGFMKVPMPLKAILRWSAQPLPVFVVGVCGRDKPSFFMISLDDILADSLQGRDPTLYEQTTITIILKPDPSLGKNMAFSIREFTRTQVPDFKSLTPEEIEANHFEILSERPPTVYEKAVLVGWAVLWKSPRRPQYFSAMFRELIRRAKTQYLDTSKPVQVIFHIYRSLRDHQHNMAVAHIDWTNNANDMFGNLKELFPWAPFRVRPGYDNDESRKYVAGRTATAVDFARYVKELATLLDSITATILQKEAKDQDHSPWNVELAQIFKDLDRRWNEMPQAPTELALVDKFMSNYISALDDNRWMRDPAANITPAQRERWYPQNITTLAGYYLALPVLLKTSGWPS